MLLAPQGTQHRAAQGPDSGSKQYIAQQASARGAEEGVGRFIVAFAGGGVCGVGPRVRMLAVVAVVTLRARPRTMRGRADGVLDRWQFLGWRAELLLLGRGEWL